MSDEELSGGCSADEVLSSFPDGVVVVGADRRVEVVNPRAVALIGRPASELVGEDVDIACPLQEDTGRSWWACIDPWNGLDIRTGHRERTLTLLGRGPVLVTMSFLREVRGGPVTRVLVALRDTDSRRRAEAENAELISLVAHELRGPLASVKGFSTTLLQRWDRFSDEQKHLMIEAIEADSERLARLIHELLDVSRLDASRLRLEPQPVDLLDVARRCAGRLTATGLDPSRFRIDVRGDDPLVWADPDRVDQIVTNLLENAVRHGAGTVYVVLEPDEAGWAVSVADEGDGIRPDQYAVVFSKFWHGSRRGSTGLGLYLVRGLVEAHGGTITVGRAPQGGALFRFTLPGVPGG
ncbi:MAG: ATP-binding protein [Mobilicoccus sp.]|nr:ATP-binding protein [Mobilicoccus sp.]